MTLLRRRTLGTPNKTVLLRNFDAASGQTFTLGTGFTTGAGKVLTLFLDFTCAGVGGQADLENLICAGLSPQVWDQLCFRWYLSTAEQLLYMGNTQQTVASGSVIRRNKAVIRLTYSSATAGSADVWLNGQQLQEGLSGSCEAGTVSISNAEGSNRLYGTYHEISILSSAMRDEQLRALTDE